MRFTHSQLSLTHIPPYFSHPGCPTYSGFTHHWGPSHRGQSHLGVHHVAHTMGAPPMASWQAIPLLTPFVAKGRRSHPTWLRTQVSGVPNVRSDRNAKEPGLLIWQSEHTHSPSDGSLHHNIKCRLSKNSGFSKPGNRGANWGNSSHVNRICVLIVSSHV